MKPAAACDEQLAAKLDIPDLTEAHDVEYVVSREEPGRGVAGRAAARQRTRLALEDACQTAT